MALIVAGPGGLDMSRFDSRYLLEGAVQERTDTVFSTLLANGVLITLNGFGFAWGADGLATAGTVTALTVTHMGQAIVQGSGFDVPALDLFFWAKLGQAVLPLTRFLYQDDTFLGSAQDDTLYSHGGNDLIDVGGGSNIAYGSVGNDTITAASSAGENFIQCGEGNDSFVGGSGHNAVNGNTGADTIVGHSAIGDWLLGGQDNDIIQASSSGHNILNGNKGEDTVQGGEGGDTLRGGQGNDLLVGGASADLMFGDLGDDTITGGGGADVFRFDKLVLAPGVAAKSDGHDRIVDFNAAAGDRVELHTNASYSVAQVGADTVISFSDGDSVTLVGVPIASLPATWLIQV